MARKFLLDSLKLPGDLRRITNEQRRLLCQDIRRRLVCTVSETGGHLASNLGIVELTVALHIVFDLPQDQVVWDVGHQSYPHKMLTGRLEQFDTIRKENGISGFTRREESEYDAFISGHASTSLSVACGLAKAKTLTQDPHHVIAVVGDGALTGGMIYEALNNAGRSGDRLIMIVNDNNMSISPNVGSLARYLAVKRASKGYNKLKSGVEETLLKIPMMGQSLRNALSHSKTAFRQMIYHSNLFEDFGFEYLGPVDGHNLPILIQTLTHAKRQNRPVIIHVNTVKGKGYTFAERNPAQYHGVGKFNLASGELPPVGRSFSDRFGKRLVEYARRDSKICAITAAMQTGTGLQPFAEEFLPQNRFFDVGIAEEHALTFACGLAAGGMRPVFAVYSTFLQRAYDQIIHDASIEPQKIVLAIDRAGIVGDDGETHQGLFDAAFLSQLPGMTIYSPATFRQLDEAMEKAFAENVSGAVAIRYPRGAQAKLPFEPQGDFFYDKQTSPVLLISYGRQLEQVQNARDLLVCEGKKSDLLALHKIHPLPPEAVEVASRYQKILFIEEGIRAGGIGEHFLHALTEIGYRGEIKLIAIENPFIPQMTVKHALSRCGLDAGTIMRTVCKCFY